MICVAVPFEGNCPWEKDILSYKDNIYRLPYKEHRPYYRVNKSPVTLSGKLRYHSSLYKEKYFGNKSTGDTLDISRQYGNELRTKASSIITKHKINTIIVSGGPFHWCYEAMKLKEEYSQIKFITDLRDFWTGGENYEHLSPDAKKEEDKKEETCIKLSDHIFSPAQRICDHLKLKYPEHQNKIKILPHAYDRTEINSIREYNASAHSNLSLAYGGILYPNMEEGIENLIQLLKHLIKRGIRVQLNIYTFDNSYQSLFENAGLKDHVIYHKSIPPNELFSILSQTDVLLQLRAGKANEQHFKSTKFYELIALRRPILYFGPKGDVSEFLINNHLGFDGNESTEELTEKLLLNKINEKIPDKQFNIEQFEFHRVTEKLIEFL